MNRPFECNRTCQFCVTRCPDRLELSQYSTATTQEGFQSWQESQTNICKYRITWVNQGKTTCQINRDTRNCEKCLSRLPQEFTVTVSSNFSK